MQTTTGTSLSRDDTQQGRVRRRTVMLLVVAAVVLILDQLTKVWAVGALQDGRVISVIGDIVQFRLVRNPGAAFSMFTNMTVALTVIAVVVVVVIVWLSRKVTSPVWAVALGGLLGGALGTLTDRIFREPGPMRGHVVDFIELPNWPVFNISDSSIVGSAILIALLSFRGVAFSGQPADVVAVGDGTDDGDVEPDVEVPDMKAGADVPDVSVGADGHGAETGSGGEPPSDDSEPATRPDRSDQLGGPDNHPDHRPGIGER
ncbi:signal peptidase II [Phytoactinopolyspora limicola]|uniref:signal peptidase II n=1 Tax=Phytoactinopolyspora limicola TaxID=2715536 RepID=UPI00140A2D7C|nr:signal peptidase II [Phytoactinopolyspora limicola]